jgi:hypothetical protein
VPIREAATWKRVRVNLDEWAGDTIRIVFVGTDGASGSLVELGVDDVRIESSG